MKRTSPNFMNNRFSRAPFIRHFKLGLLLAALPLAAVAGTMQGWVLLMMNPETAETLLSTDFKEKDNLVRLDWKLSGTGLLLTEAGPDRTMVHRMLRTAPVPERRLALSPAELAANLKEGFVSEGAMGYVSLKEQPGYVAVHCFSKNSREIWVSSDHDQSWAEHNGWKREGGIFWLQPLKTKTP